MTPEDSVDNYEGEASDTSETWAIDENGNEIPGTGYKIISAKRCPEHNVLSPHQCVGVEGHSGDHWCYDALGSYCWWINRIEIPEVKPTDAVSGKTPYGHTSYVFPADREKDTYLAHTKYEKIEDGSDS